MANPSVVTVLTGNALQRFRQVLKQMKAVRHLGRRGRPLLCAVGVGFRPITHDHLHPWMLPEPLGQGLGRAIREKRDRLLAFEINEHRAIALAFA